MSRSSKQQFSPVASGEPCYTDCNIKDNNLDDDNVNGDDDDGNKKDDSIKRTCCTIMHSSHTAAASLSLLKVIHLLLVSVA